MRASTNRIAFTVWWSLAVVLAIGLVRPVHDPDNMGEEEFYLKKMLWNRQFDMVVAGDSRTLIAVSPQKLHDTFFPTARICNFAFRMNGYSRQYLDRLSTLLDPASKHPVLVLGIDPHALTPNAARDLDRPQTWMSVHPWRPGHFNVEPESEFLYLNSLDPGEIRTRVRFSELFAFLAPLRAFDFAQLLHLPYYAPRTIFHEDGWCAVVGRGMDLNRLVHGLPLLYMNNQVSDLVVNKLTERVGQWRSHGITVYGFELPTTRLVAKIEEERSGFNRQRFISMFRTAGGQWLELPTKFYATADGHHLLLPAGIELSGDLAQAIAKREARH